MDSVLTIAKVSDEIIGFHCQQAIEKLLKALLIILGVRFRKTHDLRELLDLIAKNECFVPDEFNDVDELSPYAVEYRYEMMATSVEVFDRSSERKKIKRLRNWVEQEIQKRTPSIQSQG